MTLFETIKIAELIYCFDLLFCLQLARVEVKR